MSDDVRCLSLHQPWASLCVPLAPGEKPVKTMETRGSPTTHRGRLLIHAAKRAPVGGAIGDFYVEPWYDDVRHLEHACYCEPDGITPECGRRGTRHQVLSRGVTGERVVSHLPLGAIVGSCELVDVVPTDAIEWGRGSPQSGWARVRDVAWANERERPYGDFTPGRYAYLLGDAKRTDERCPACWGEGGHQLIDAIRDYVYCRTCDGKGSCPPIPAKGRQGLWSPDFRAQLDRAVAS